MTEDIFKGKVILVTGAAHGTGRCLAERLAQMGAIVGMVDIDPVGKDVESSIRQKGGQADFIRCDMNDMAQVEGIVPLMAARYGRVDILINGAAICPVKAFIEMEMAEIDSVMQINFRSAMALTRKVSTLMIGRKQGIIVNLLASPGSNQPEVGAAFLSAYSSSKAALAAFSLSIAPELNGYNIKTIGLWTGMVRTPAEERAYQQLATRMGKSYSDFEKMMTAPESVVDAIVQVLLHSDQYHGRNVELSSVVSSMRPSDAPELIAAPEPSSSPIAPPVQTNVIDEMAATIAAMNISSKEAALAIHEVMDNIEKLPDFARPMIRSDFKKRVGDEAENLRSQIDQIHLWSVNLGAAWKRKDESSISVQGGKIIATYAQREGSLRKLAQFVRESADSAGRYYKEQVDIKAFHDRSMSQAASIDALCDELGKLQEIMLKYLSK